MKIDRTELIRLQFSAMVYFWNKSETLIFAPCATIEEWKNVHESLAKVISQAVPHDTVMVSGGEEKVSIEQREDNGKLFIQFEGGIMYSQWGFAFTVNDAQKFLDYIGEMLK